LAKVLKISVASVNYYTNLGLFKVMERKGNARLYDQSEITRVFETIQRLRREGYSLHLIQKRLDKGYNI
jgi:DNA-binding transcriptional MerR regulator